MQECAEYGRVPHSDSAGNPHDSKSGLSIVVRYLTPEEALVPYPPMGAAPSSVSAEG